MSTFDNIERALEEIAQRGSDLRISVEFEQGFNYEAFNDESKPTIISGNIIDPKTLAFIGHYRYIDGIVSSFILRDKEDNVVVDTSIDFWSTNEEEAREEIVEIVQNLAVQFLT